MILRTTFTDGQVFFEDLGDKFLLTSKQRCPEKYEGMYKGHFGKGIETNCFAFASPLYAGWSDIPLYTDYNYSILNDRGVELMRVSIGGL